MDKCDWDFERAAAKESGIRIWSCRARKGWSGWIVKGERGILSVTVERDGRKEKAGVLSYFITQQKRKPDVIFGLEPEQR
jgi:hypothetical protein